MSLRLLPALVGGVALTAAVTQAAPALLPIYTIRLHVIRTSDDDGTHPATISTPQLLAAVTGANKVFESAGIKFLFTSSDVEDKKSSLMNQDFDVNPSELNNDKNHPPTQLNAATHSQGRTTMALKFAGGTTEVGQLVVFFHYGSQLSYESGKWKVGPRTGGESSGTSAFVEMNPSGSGNDLAHELGHYLHLSHTFPNGLDAWTDSLKDAAEWITKYGFDVFDGDKLSDTPHDARGGIFAATYGDRCAPPVDATVSIVAGKKTYVFKPDRLNVMSYFKGCGLGQNHFSPQQAEVMRAALKTGNRSNLVVTDWSRANRNFCRTPGETMRVGDFNGDHYDDLVCTSTNGAMHVDLSAKGWLFGSDWVKGDRNFCKASDESLYVGDFNGDGRTDVLCNATSGAMHVDLADAQGRFLGSDWSKGDRNFCKTAGETMRVGDVNGDHRADLVCTSTNGAMHVDLADAQGRFLGSDWVKGDRNFCKASDERFFVGDFNGDGRVDLLCNATSGAMHVDLADAQGRFLGSDWSQGDRNFCKASNEKLYVGDFNGDGRADLLCNATSGVIHLDVADAQGRFRGSDWVKGDRNFCKASNEKLHVGDFNGDGHSDLLCNASSGTMQVIFADASGHFE